MIPGANNKIQSFKHKSAHEENSQKNKTPLSKSVTETKFSLKEKIKTRVEREKPLVKQQIQNVATLHKNEVQKQVNQTDISDVFSRKNSSKFAYSLGRTAQTVKPTNQNGFSTFPPFTQALPILFFVLMVSDIVVLSVLYLEGPELIIILGFQGLLLMLITYLWYLTTSISPTDTIQLHHLQHLKNNMDSSFDAKKYKYFCNLCKTCVGQRSFHCNTCNRCVEYFDHHCKWLNNCIGSKNYIEFIQLVMCSELFMIFFYIANALIINVIIQNHDNLPPMFWYACANITASIVPFIAITMLMTLHLYLFIAKRSTIELILQNRKKNKIHPYRSNQQFFEKNNKITSLPFESPDSTPNFLKQSTHAINDTSQQSEEKLNKFKANLSKSLRLSKVSSKFQIAKIQQEGGKKIVFKRTILKKISHFTNQSNTNNSPIKKKDNGAASHKKQINQQLVESSQDTSLEESSKNLFSKLRFSTSNQKIKNGDKYSQKVQTSRKQQKQSQVDMTQRKCRTNRKQKPSKSLQPAKRHQIEKKIQFKSKAQTLNKQNSSFHAEANNKTKTTQKAKQQEGSKPTKTRLFKVLSTGNKKQGN